jgi:hypothetical protein
VGERAVGDLQGGSPGPHARHGRHEAALGGHGYHPFGFAGQDPERLLSHTTRLPIAGTASA